MKVIIGILVVLLITVIAGRNTDPIIYDRYITQVRYTSGHIDTLNLNYKPRICPSNGISWLCNSSRVGKIPNVEYVKVLKFIPKKKEKRIKKRGIGRGKPYYGDKDEYIYNCI